MLNATRYLSGATYTTGNRHSLGDLVGAGVLGRSAYRTLAAAGVQCYCEETRSTEEAWTAAARACLSNALVDPADLDAFVIVRSESNAAAAFRCLSGIGAPRSLVVNLALHDCGGLSTALHVAASLINGTSIGTVMVIAGGRCTRPAQRIDRHLNVAFSDGAVACVVSARRGDFEIRASHGISDASLTTTWDANYRGTKYLVACMRLMRTVVETACHDAGIGLDDLRLAFCTSPNLEILHFMCGGAGLPRSKVYARLLDDHGHAFCCDSLIALCDYARDEALTPGDHFLFYSWAPFGVGATVLTYAGR